MPGPIYSPDYIKNAANRIQDFVPFLADYFPVTTDYGAPTAKGPNAGDPHYAVDWGTPTGTPLYSMGSGKVLQPDGNPEHVTGGKTITVDYGNGIIVSFAHLSEVFVKPGDSIAPGDFIGKTGNTGITTAPHLHVDAWKDGAKVDVRTLVDWTSDFTDYEHSAGATGGSVPILGPATGAFRDAGEATIGLAQGVIGFLGALLNPENWARILAIFGGAILTLLGMYWVWQSTGA